jgi:pimeloyl-ACP methyl ester carboxylesterase
MGLRRNSEWWYCQLPTLSEQFQVPVFDNRSAGRSDQSAMDYSIPLFADDTAALMKSLACLFLEERRWKKLELRLDY